MLLHAPCHSWDRRDKQVKPTFVVKSVPLNGAHAFACLGIPSTQSRIALAAACHYAPAVCGEGTAADGPIVAAQNLAALGRVRNCCSEASGQTERIL